ncbi:MAG TPA: zf-HC2 domain-containing protein, partial [Actinomycetes bacterium]
MSWHVDEQSLARYAAGQAGAVSAASTEAHLTSCELCRTRLAPAVPGERLAGIWDEVAERVDAGNLPWFERVLVRVGVREDTARLLAATPSLGTAWLAAVAAAVVFAAAASDTSPRGLFLYLTLAPMLPVAGVAAAYGR